ncbi:dipeptidase [Xanthomonas oryzae pv. oryzicola BLS256]|uniref:Dipeptidase n=1 Tax=Xanthomonas oryzae pv. oryzicola (strain BLS256) TaxID=383407 RepID=G7TD08_XANOB|nr:dipeptidase [Xanthomonas oryzae pv. oryzicola BLS256]QEO99922.1 dipeptidase [Xanthomonas oryzae pv. oryzicola]
MFDQLIALSPVPIVLSHSGARAVYNHPRNIDDARLKVLAVHGGVIRVNSYGGYLVDSGASPERKAVEKALTDHYGGREHVKIADATKLSVALKELDARYPITRATEEDFCAHFEHLLAVVGPEHVGIGMDRDGAGGVVGRRCLRSAAHHRVAAAQGLHRAADRRHLGQQSAARDGPGAGVCGGE